MQGKTDHSETVSFKDGIEGLRVGDTLRVLAASWNQLGWRHNTRPNLDGDQRVVVFPDESHPVRRYKLQFHQGVLFVIEAEYRSARSNRIDIAQNEYPIYRNLSGVWAMANPEHSRIVYVSADGSSVSMIDKVRAPSADEFQAMIKQIVE